MTKENAAEYLPLVEALRDGELQVNRMTPAQAAGVENSAWTVGELIERCGE